VILEIDGNRMIFGSGGAGLSRPQEGSGRVESFSLDYLDTIHPSPSPLKSLSSDFGVTVD